MSKISNFVIKCVRSSSRRIEAHFQPGLNYPHPMIPTGTGRAYDARSLLPSQWNTVAIPFSSTPCHLEGPLQ